MNSLAIDTATTALGLALRSASGLHSVQFQVGLKHSEKLMPAVRALLREADLTAAELELIVCSTGPGSFTGIRIGLATAKGLVHGVRAAGAPAAAGCRLMGVSTLDGLAWRYRSHGGLVVAVNPSLRKKHYAALYRGGRLHGEYLETTLEELAALLRAEKGLLITGAAAGALSRMLMAEGRGTDHSPIVEESGQPCDPLGLLACGESRLSEPEAEPLPLYLRKSEAEITFFGE